jgi:hypothetical protein
MPPPIRYPLPTLIAVLLIGLVAWRGAGWLRIVSGAVSARWQRVVEGPPVPSSTSPMVVAGPIIRRGLILRDGAPVSSRPEAKPTGTITLRIFVDISDLWPLNGPTTHFRVGNRGLIGWVASADCLAWDTRLVIRAPGGRLSLARKLDGPTVEVDAGSFPLPVTAWQASWVEVAVWRNDQPWSTVESRGWVDLARLPRSSVGVLIAREELPALLLGLDDPASQRRGRLLAILGRLGENPMWSAHDIDTAFKALPARISERSAAVNPSERIAVLNASPSFDAAWSGHKFKFVPLDDLP